MNPFKRILAPTDFSPYSDEGLRYAAFLAEKFGSEVVVLHVLAEEKVEQLEVLPSNSKRIPYTSFVIDNLGAKAVGSYVMTPKRLAQSETAPPPPHYLDEIFQETEQEAAKHFRKVTGGEGNGLKVKFAAASGVPFVEIIRKAREEGCDLIVMVTHGRTGLSHVLVGSVAEKVVRMADCPVITVRPEELQFEMAKEAS